MKKKGSRSLLLDKLTSRGRTASRESLRDASNSQDGPTIRDNYPSSGPSVANRFARRASNALEKLPHWLSKGKENELQQESSEQIEILSTPTDEASVSSSVKKKPSRPSLTLRASVESLRARATGAMSSHRAGPPSPTTSTHLQVPQKDRAMGSSSSSEMEYLNNDDTSNETGLPRRLTGWMLNMIGGESQAASRASVEVVEQASKPIPAPDESVAATPVHELVKKPSDTSSSAAHSVSSGKAKEGGLFASFSAAAKARAAAATTASFSASESSEQTEEIWLLGVRHGPSALPSSPPLIELSSATPQKRQQQMRQRASTPASPTMSDCSSRLTAVSSGGSVGNTSPISHNNSRTLEEEGHSSPQAVRSRRETSVPMRLDSPPPINSRPLDPARSSQSSIPSSHHSISDPQIDFKADFTSRVWCSYRSAFVPITRDGTISQEAEQAAALAASKEACLAADKTAPKTPTPSTSRTWLGVKATGDADSSMQSSQSLGSALGVATSPTMKPSPGMTNLSGAAAAMSLSDKLGIPGLWGRATAAVQATGLTGRTGLTTDAGWGCMLRTGQSLLANALLQVHLGRDWKRSHPPVKAPEAPLEYEEQEAWREERHRYATYVKILSWFMDDPSSGCPFGVHRMAREGKRLGKEVGEWFGPSTAAGAVKKLVDEFPEAGIGVSMATDGVVYLSEVRAAAVLPSNEPASVTDTSDSWQRPVVVLVGIRLGLDGVNPMYYESIKRLFTFPQSVGIAGGRPSSSYYFLGYQGSSLFYLDPHQVRPAVPYRHPPSVFPAVEEGSIGHDSQSSHANDDDNADEWWAHAFTEAELATFHCDKPRRMPLRSLDPSMLLGFLVQDPASLEDLASRVRGLPKAIFSIQEELPRWMRDGSEEDDFEGSGDELEPSLESYSESSFDGDDNDERSPALETEDSTETPRNGDPTLIDRAGADSQRTSHSHSPARPSAMPNTSRTTSTETASASQPVGSPRYGSGLRFPSSASTATARQISSASTARQPSDLVTKASDEVSEPVSSRKGETAVASSPKPEGDWVAWPANSPKSKAIEVKQSDPATAAANVGNGFAPSSWEEVGSATSRARSHQFKVDTQVTTKSKVSEWSHEARSVVSIEKQEKSGRSESGEREESNSQGIGRTNSDREWTAVSSEGDDF